MISVTALPFFSFFLVVQDGKTKRSGTKLVSFFWLRPRPLRRGGPHTERHRAGAGPGHSHHSAWGTKTRATINKHAACDPAPKSHRNRLLLQDLQKVGCRPQISNLYDYAGLRNLAERLIHRTMLNPKPCH